MLKKRNVLLIPILVLFGINMVLATTNAIQWMAEDNFRNFSEGTTANLVRQITPKIEAAITALPPDAEDARVRQVLDATVLVGPLVGYEWFDARGTSRLFSDAGRSPLADPGAGARPDVGRQRFTNSGTTQQYSHADLDLPGTGPVSGRLRLFVDQSNAFALFYASHSDITYISGWFLAVALFVVIFVVWSRIKEQWATDRELRYLAHHDGLTGLPKRENFVEKLNYVVSRTDPDSDLAALLFLDIDKFKQINDTLGHATGDALLREFAGRLRENTRKTDLLCRLGGDEFALALVGLKSPERVVPFANRLCRILAQPYVVDGREFVSSASIGVSIAPIDATDAEALFKCADLALYRSKAEGGRAVCFFETSMDVAFQQRMQLEQELKTAIENNQFELYYQPQYDLNDGSLRTHEALLRWHHPIRGMVHPGDFISIAEENGLIMALDQWVLDRACSDAMAWDTGQNLAVNLSPSQFRAGSVADTVASTLRTSGFPANRLEIEITESLLLNSTVRVTEQLAKLKEIGVGIVIDDFGTGHSSLSCLASSPLDKIKIDHSLIAGLSTDPTIDTMVRTVIRLGHDLGMTVTAEGVETREQEQILKSHGCDHGQGYLYGRPAPGTARPKTGNRKDAVIYTTFRPADADCRRREAGGGQSAEI